MYKRCSKNMKPLWNVNGFFNRTSWKVIHVQIVRYTWVFGCEKRMEWLIPFAVSLRRAGVEQLYQVKRMIGGIGNMFVSMQCSECQSDEISNKRG